MHVYTYIYTRPLPRPLHLVRQNRNHLHPTLHPNTSIQTLYAAKHTQTHPKHTYLPYQPKHTHPQHEKHPTPHSAYQTHIIPRPRSRSRIRLESLTEQVLRFRCTPSVVHVRPPSRRGSRILRSRRHSQSARAQHRRRIRSDLIAQSLPRVRRDVRRKPNPGRVSRRVRDIPIIKTRQNT